MDCDSSPANFFEHHEVVHVPVHDGGKTQLVEVFQLKSNRPTSKMHLMRHLNQTFQGDPFKGYRMTAPKRV